MEELITIQKYASLNRLSIHATIKKTMNGELRTVAKEENGKEVTYILNPKSQEKEIKTTNIDENPEGEISIDYKKEYEELHREYLTLKNKYQKLLNS